MTAAEILDALPANNDSVVFTKDNLRVKLDELVEKGFVRIRKKGRNILYSLAEDIWQGFSDDELLDICLFLEFLKNVSPIEMPYYFLHEKLILYLSAERGRSVAEKDIFHFKHVCRYLNQMPDKFASQKTVCFLTRCQNRIHTHSCCFFQRCNRVCANVKSTM